MPKIKNYKNTGIKICVIDDEEILRITVSGDLQDAGHEVVDFESPLEALEYIEKHPEIEIVVSDIKMPQMDGLTLLEKVKNINPDICVIMMTAYGTVKSAVQAIKLGAFDYLTKPFEPEELTNLIDKIAEINCLRKRNTEFKKHFKKKYDLDLYYGESESVKKIKENVKLVANSDSTALITGETGTGK